MTEGPGARDAANPFTDEERASGQDVFGLGSGNVAQSWAGSART
jgi:hypothetical protein